MKIHSLLIAILVVGMMTLGMTSYLVDLSEGYDTEVDTTTFDDTSKRVGKIQNESEEIKTIIENMSISNPLEAIELPYEMVQTGWKGIKIMIGGIGTTESVFTDSMDAVEDSGIPLPKWLLPSIMAIITIIIITIIIFAFFKWRMED